MRSMKRLYLCFGAALLLPVVAADAGDGKVRHVPEKVPNSYIVMLVPGQDASVTASDFERLNRGHVDAIMDRLGAISITLGSETAAENIARDPRVDFVQENGILHVADCRQLDSSGSQWSLGHLNNITQSYLFGDTLGSSVHSVRVYVIDTWIDDSTLDFRACYGCPSKVSAPVYTMQQCAGGGEGPGPYKVGWASNHGGAVASLIAGNIHGVVPEVSSITSIVAIDSCTGSSSDSALTEAANYVIQTHSTGTPAVANVSIAATYSDSVFDAAMKSMVDNGVFVAVAAGNSTLDSCTISAAELGGINRYPGLMAVGATSINGTKESYSSYGACIDIWAPGGDATYPVSASGGYADGTSVAAPDVTGAAIVILSKYPLWSPANVWYQIKQDSANYSFTPSLRIPNGCTYVCTDTNVCTPLLTQ